MPVRFRTQGAGARLSPPAVVALGVGRAVVGATMLVLPGLLPRVMSGGGASTPGWVVQMLGAGEVAVGLGSAAGARRDRSWLAAGLLCDAVDALAIAGATGRGRVRRAPPSWRSRPQPSRCRPPSWRAPGADAKRRAVGSCTDSAPQPHPVVRGAYRSRMRLLHTSDWHLGRSLHQHDLGAAQAAYVDHVVEAVRRERVDVVVHAGDVHDRALPPVEAMQLFDEALRRLRDAGAAVVAISGNHDAPARLGDKAGLLDRAIAIRTDPARVAEPVLVEDEHGPVAFYAVPYLEPAAVRGVLPGPDAEPDGPVAPGAHTRVLSRAMAAVHADRAVRGGRSVVLAHAWVTGGQGSESERDISVGGVAHVPASLFDGVDYTALGHLHRPQDLRTELRYSGSPLPYSFGEGSTAKRSLLVELDAAGLARVEEVAAPVHRRLTALRGRLSDLLESPAHREHENDFVSVVLTDPAKQLDAMASLRRRFPFALELRHEPEGSGTGDATSYGARTQGRSDLEVAELFVAHVRTDPAERERALLREALEDARRVELVA